MIDVLQQYVNVPIPFWKHQLMVLQRLESYPGNSKCHKNCVFDPILFISDKCSEGKISNAKM